MQLIINEILKKANSQLAKIRKVFEKNRIYFEILISISAIIIAIKANEISNRQIDIERKLSQPHFNVEYESVSKSLIIHANEAKYENLMCEIISTIELRYPDSTGFIRHSSRVYIYDNMRDPFQPKLGVKMNFNLIDQNDSVYINVGECFINYITNKFPPYSGFIFLKTYLKLSYIDFYGEGNIIYYDISQGLGFRIDNEFGKKIFDNTSRYIVKLEKLPYFFDFATSNYYRLY
jgi:hypothetical protein